MSQGSSLLQEPQDWPYRQIELIDVTGGEAFRPGPHKTQNKIPQQVRERTGLLTLFLWSVTFVYGKKDKRLSNKRHSVCEVAECRMKDYAAAPVMAIQLCEGVFGGAFWVSFSGNL